MKRVLVMLVAAATTATAQDSSFSQLRLRGAALRLPVIGHIGDDWRASTGIQVEVGSNVGVGELALAVGHVAFNPVNAKPPFTETFFSLGWTRPIASRSRGSIDLGARLTDVRMDFDDPSMVGGLRTEEEVLISALGRGHLTLGRGFSGFAEASYGLFMLSTRTPTAAIAIGIEHGLPMPDWLRGILR
jgi:hypothetical protein